MRVEVDGVRVGGVGWRERCATSIENASGYVVVVISVLEGRSVTLVSCYLAGLGGATGVSHLALMAGEQGRLAQRVAERMPGQSHARACLLDHAAQLCELLEDVLGEEAGVEVDETALDAAARVWRRTVR